MRFILNAAVVIGFMIFVHQRHLQPTLWFEIRRRFRRVTQLNETQDTNWGAPRQVARPALRGP